MSVFIGIDFSKIDTGNIKNEKYAIMVRNYMMELNENLQYMFSHIEEDNMTDQTVKNLTAGYINVTNGANSMILDPDVGFKMTKGSKNQFFFDIITGDVEYSGKMIGGLIQSSNYSAGTEGMMINLDEGTWDSVGFKYDGLKCDIKGKFSSTGNIYSVTINEGKINAQYLDLSSGNNMIWATATEMNVKNASQTLRVTPGGITWYANDFSSGGTFLTTDNFQYSMDGVDGMFATADGKTVTVYDGVITDIS